MKKERIEEFNPWWFTGKVPEELLQNYRRKLFYKIMGSLEKRYVVSIVGLRRTGKTTIMFQIIQTLLEGTEKSNVLYFNFDEYAESLDELMDAYRELKSKDPRHDKIYVFLDEVQKLSNWSNQLKKYYDLYPKIKFFVSGSEGLFIASGTKETLAGRISEFRLDPLSFGEYVEIKGAHPSIAKMKSLFSEYLENGGFPELIGKSRQEIRDYVRSVVLDKVIFKDIVTMFGVKDTETIRQLVEIIASNPGMYLDYQSLAKQLGKDRRSIKTYIMLLHESFLIKIMGNYRKGRLAGIRKLKKAYPTDTSIITAFSHAIDERLTGYMAETAVVNALRAASFWKNSHEVDVIHDGLPIEIKFREKIADNDMSGVREFMRKFKARKGVIVTKSDERTIRTEEGAINLVPAWKFLLKR